MTWLSRNFWQIRFGFLVHVGALFGEILLDSAASVCQLPTKSRFHYCSLPRNRWFLQAPRSTYAYEIILTASIAELKLRLNWTYHRHLLSNPTHYLHTSPHYSPTFTPCWPHHACDCTLDGTSSFYAIRCISTTILTKGRMTSVWIIYLATSVGAEMQCPPGVSEDSPTKPLLRSSSRRCR